MERPFDAELKKLRNELMNMTDLIEKAVSKAVKSFIVNDRSMAESVIKNDIDIDKIDLEIEENCLKLIALYQPAGKDLRFITMSMQIRIDLERIGDLAVDICDETMKLDKKDINFTDDLKILYEKSIKMVKDAVSSFISRDPELAKEVWNSDDAVDALNSKIIDNSIKHMVEHGKNIKSLTSLIAVSRCLERVADHATNVAEDVVYMYKGEIIMHSRELKK